MPLSYCINMCQQGARGAAQRQNPRLVCARPELDASTQHMQAASTFVTLPAPADGPASASDAALPDVADVPSPNADCMPAPGIPTMCPSSVSRCSAQSLAVHQVPSLSLCTTSPPPAQPTGPTPLHLHHTSAWGTQASMKPSAWSVCPSALTSSGWPLSPGGPPNLAQPGPPGPPTPVCSVEGPNTPLLRCATVCTHLPGGPEGSPLLSLLSLPERGSSDPVLPP